MKLQLFHITVPEFYHDYLEIEAYDHEDAALAAIETLDDDLLVASDNRIVTVVVIDDDGVKKTYKVSGGMEPVYHASEVNQKQEEKMQ